MAFKTLVALLWVTSSLSFAKTKMNNDAPSPFQEELQRSAEQGSDVRFGAYKLRLSFGKPEFTKDLKYYSKLYGDSVFYPSIRVDRAMSQRYLTLGFGGQIGYYTDTGHPAQKNQVDDPTDEDIVRIPGKTSLTLIPINVLLTAQISPFARRWVFVDFWLGYEEIFYQEVRESQSTTTAQISSFRQLARSPMPNPKVSMATQATKDESKIYNSGWSNGMSLGAAMNFKLNALDEKSVSSMDRGLGFGSIYLSPFVEIISNLGAKKNLIAGKNSSPVKFSRQVVGFALTFESSSH